MAMTEKGSRKPRDWCEQQAIDHAWECGPVLASYPPQPTRICRNCGKTQIQKPAQWVDAS